MNLKENLSSLTANSAYQKKMRSMRSKEVKSSETAVERQIWTRLEKKICCIYCSVVSIIVIWKMFWSARTLPTADRPDKLNSWGEEPW